MRLSPSQLHPSFLLLASLFVVPTALADVYQVDFTGSLQSDPTNPPPIQSEFTFDTGSLENNSFEAASGFACGSGGQDCFAAASSYGEAAVVYRNGTIQFVDLPEHNPNDQPMYFLSASLFTGSDDDPHILTGAYDATYAPFYYVTYTGTATIADETSPAPEPSTLALLGTGLVGIAGSAWRRLTR